jgi:hypothetical protein
MPREYTRSTVLLRIGTTATSTATMIRSIPALMRVTVICDRRR